MLVLKALRVYLAPQGTLCMFAWTCRLVSLVILIGMSCWFAVCSVPQELLKAGSATAFETMLAVSLQSMVKTSLPCCASMALSRRGDPNVFLTVCGQECPMVCLIG